MVLKSRSPKISKLMKCVAVFLMISLSFSIAVFFEPFLSAINGFSENIFHVLDKIKLLTIFQ